MARRLMIASAIVVAIVAVSAVHSVLSAHDSEDDGATMGHYGAPTHMPGSPCGHAGYDYGNGHGPMMGHQGMPMMDPRHMPMMGYGRMPMMGRAAAVIDRDGDGMIAASEAAAHFDRRFGLLDGDGNDVLEAGEYIGRSGTAWATMYSEDPRYQSRRAYRHDRFEALDADDDGRVARAEFMEAGRQRFAAADLDGDGDVTVWEFRSTRRL